MPTSQETTYLVRHEFTPNPNPPYPLCDAYPAFFGDPLQGARGWYQAGTGRQNMESLLCDPPRPTLHSNLFVCLVCRERERETERDTHTHTLRI